VKLAVRDDLLRRLTELDTALVTNGQTLDRHERALLELVAVVRALVRELGGD
jgi:hypothetical protein